MQLLTWNLNGFRAVKKKGLEDILEIIDADIVCFQETKAQPDQIDLSKDLYPYQYINSAVKKGYSGVMIASQIEAEKVTSGIGVEEHDQEGRVLTAEFEKFVLVNVYTPNSQDGQRRLDYRISWDQAFASYCKNLTETLNKPILICGDLNIARGEMDIWDEKDGIGSAGYTPQERENFENLLMPFVCDVFREKYPDTRKYSWWSYYSRGRENNRGWRIDYWLASPSLMPYIRDIEIMNDVFGSDHCPVLLKTKRIPAGLEA
jgi:exodeoxyribonuclease-3